MKSLDGGAWVDVFGAMILIRLIGPLFRLPPMNAAEAGTWAATIAAFAATNIGGPRSS
jgi:hypothetical protein